MKKIITIFLIGIGVIILFFVADFIYQEWLSSIKLQTPVACTMEAKICPDGSAVGRTGPNCEFTPCPNTIIYRNEEFGFELALPLSWQGYSVDRQTWQGWKIDGSGTGKIGDYNGLLIVIKNPQTTAEQKWQDIPIMVFAPDVWQLVQEEKVAVSAAPIAPAKVGENSKYVFATPPRWYGFTDAVGFEEALNIVKTFKAF